MTGNELRKKIQEKGVSALFISQKLGITPQSLNSTFKAIDVRSGTIEKIAEALGEDMSFFYPIENRSTVASGKGSVAVSGNNNVTGIASADVAVLKERIAMLEKLIDEKERTIKILMGK